MPNAGRPVPAASVLAPAVVAVWLVLLWSAQALALVVTVDTTTDNAALTACDDDTPNDCSLRGALVAAATAGEHRDIRVPAGTYTLTASTSCQFTSAFGGTDTSPTTALCLRGDVAIIGSGATATVIDGNITDRAVLVTATATAAITGVTITHGAQSGGSFVGGGGGILNHGTLTLADVVLTANTTAIGGGALSNKGTVTAVRCRFVANAANQYGGAIDNGHTGAGSARSSGTLTLIDSTLSANNAGLGGALFNVGSEVTIVGSTVSGNTGGAIFNQGYGGCDFSGCYSGIGTINLTNSTITGNTGGTAAAIDNGRSAPSQLSVVNLRNATITGNTGTPSCGGVLNAEGGILTLENTILAGNAPAAVQCCPFGNTPIVSGGYNVLGDGPGQGCAVTGDTTGNTTGITDPLLGALAANGGETETRAPLAGSPAVDAGSPAEPGSGGAACAAVDQRRVLRPLGSRCDIGAVERATTLALTRIAPATGAAGGSVIVVASGGGFDPGATVVLRRTGSADIAAAPVTIDAGGAALAARFDLTGAALGAWDVVVTNPDTASATLTGAFTAETARAPDLWAILVARRAVGAGYPARFTVVFGNRGNSDAFAVPLTLVIPAPFATRFQFEIANPPSQGGQVYNDYSDVDVAVTTDDPTAFRNVPFLLPVVPAGFTGTLDFLVTPPAQIPEGASFLVSALVGTPFFSGDAPRSDVVDAMVEGAKRFAANHLGVTIPALLDGTLAQYASNELTLAVDAGVASVVGDLGHVRRADGLAYLTMDLAAFGAAEATAAAPAVRPTMLASLGRRLAALVGLHVASVEAETACAPCICGKATVLEPGCSCGEGNCTPAPDDGNPPKKPPKPFGPADCRDIGGHVVSADGTSCIPDGSRKCPKGIGQVFFSDAFCRTIPIAIDPNDKSGSPGAGEGRFVTGTTPLPYSIAFENLPAAPAAAQTVTITDQLDTQTLDLETFSFGTVTVADASYTPPPGQTAFTGAIDLRPRLGIIVKIDATLAKPSGLVTWTFTSLDPATLDAVTDADAGFLPPNTTPPQGDGSVAFLVAPKAGLVTGTEIKNSASIVFDVNAPLATPEWLNTVDVTAPQSKVDVVTGADCTATDLTVSWSGTDAGGGIASYTLYVSENGGPATPLVVDTTDTSAPFTATLGKTYGFHTVARDVVGNVEAAPAVPDVVRPVADCATNDLAVTKISAPKKLTLSAKKPTRTAVVKVKVQNRSAHAETIADATTYAQLVRLTVDSDGACAAPTIALNPTKQPKAKKYPLTLKSKGALVVAFDVAIACATDPAKGAGHEDYAVSARVDHTALGSGDAHPADDVCPRTIAPPGVVDAFPNGKIVDKGCGAKKPDKTFGAPILIDVESK